MPLPNIIYIHSHDTGRYIQPYGHAVPTPSLQRLAEQGVMFRQAFCAAPTCSPSRAALLTGQSPHSAGMFGLAHRGFRLNDYSQHLLHTLRAAGYFSALAGMQHVANDASVIGYDEVIPMQRPYAAVVGPAASAFLGRQAGAGRAGKRPFYLEVGFWETHRVLPEPTSAEDERFCLPPAPLPDTPEIRRDVAAYKASARQLDAGIGQVLAELHASGLMENTLIIATTDHGIAFPGMKCSLTDHGIGVYLIMRGPGGSGFTGGRVCDAMVSHIDLFPTLCDYLGLARPAWLQGKSIMPLVRGEASEINDEIFAEVTYHAAFEPMRAVRTKRWKYIRRFDGRGRPVASNTDDSPSKTAWVERGGREQFVAPEELFDLALDPQERRNVAGDATVPGAAAALAEMRGRLDAWMKGTNDPLMHGLKIPLPGPIKVNDVDGLSPSEPSRVVGPE